MAQAVNLRVPELSDAQRALYGLSDDGGSERRANKRLVNTKSAYRLSLMARSALRGGDVKRARALIDRSLSIRTDLPFAHYTRAGCQVRNGDLEAGLDSLARSIDMGMQPSRQSLQLCADFELVRTHPRFVKLLETLK